MGELADLLSKSSPDAGPDPGDGGSDERSMAEASVKAFFEAGKKGDWQSATDHLTSAMQHCQGEPDMDDMGGGGDAEDGSGPKKPGLLIAIGHKK